MDGDALIIWLPEKPFSKYQISDWPSQAWRGHTTPKFVMLFPFLCTHKASDSLMCTWSLCQTCKQIQVLPAQLFLGFLEDALLEDC